MKLVYGDEDANLKPVFCIIGNMYIAGRNLELLIFGTSKNFFAYEILDVNTYLNALL